MGEKKILIILIVLVLLYIAFKYFFKNKEKFTTSSKSKEITEESTEEITEQTSNNKPTSSTNVVKFYGADYCPYSNKNSPSYKIMKDFEESYPDVQVYYYWIGKDDEEMKDLNIEYVPTILNGKNKSIELKLPEGITPEGKTGEDLKIILLEAIHNQL